MLGVAHNDANNDTELLSISFDPIHDDRRASQLYGSRYGAAAPRWRIAAPTDQDDLAALLRSLGAVVIAAGQGGFVHTSGVYVIDPLGRLVRILDPEQPSALLAAIRQVAR